jgi:hypothetical protein
MGGDVAGKGDAGSPGSGGASPYLRRGFPCSLAGQCHPPKLSVDYLTTTQERRIIRVADRASDNAQGPRKSWSTLTTNLWGVTSQAGLSACVARLAYDVSGREHQGAISRHVILSPTDCETPRTGRHRAFPGVLYPAPLQGYDRSGRPPSPEEPYRSGVPSLSNQTRIRGCRDVW